MKKIYYLFMTAVFTTLFVSCAGVKSVVEKTKPIPTSLTIVFTNSTMGAFEAGGCGCRHLGGLARRAYFINDTRKNYPNVITFDTGNILFDRKHSPPDMLQTKADYMVSALQLMQLDALNIGAHDCLVGPAYLQEKKKSLHFPFLSANLRSTVSSELLFSPYVIKDIDSKKIGVFGLSGYGNPLRLKAENIYIDKPLQAAQQAVNVLQQQGCSLIILLSQLRQSENKRIAEQVPGLDFILGSASKTILQNPLLAGSTALLSPGTGGTHAALLTINFRNDSAPFYNDKERRAVMERIAGLKVQEVSFQGTAVLEEAALMRAVLEEKLKSYEGKNSYSYSVFALDKKVPDDPAIGLIVEKYKQALLKNKLATYSNQVPAVDMSTLQEEKKLMALRLMNEITCNESGSIAASADWEPFCKKLASLILAGINMGQSEGKIRYSILYEKEKLKKPLDKNPGLQ